MGKIQILKQGITSLNTDALVNAANEGLWEGGGVCGIIFQAAGSQQLQAACSAIGGCKTGSAVITPGFNLKSKYIIHAVGPRWIDGKHNEPKLLYSAYKQSLILAVQNGCKSIGFPLISAGIFGYPIDQAWRKALQACLDFQQNNPSADLDIQFAVIDDNALAVGRKTLAELDKEKTTLYLKQLDAEGLQNVKQVISATNDLIVDKSAQPMAAGLMKVLCEKNTMDALTIDQLIEVIEQVFPSYVMEEGWNARYCDILLRAIDEVKKSNPNQRAQIYETKLRSGLIPKLKDKVHSGGVMDELSILIDIYKVAVCLYRYYSEREKEFSFRADFEGMKKLDFALLEINNIGNQFLGVSFGPVRPEERRYAFFLSWVLGELLKKQEELEAGDLSWI